MKIMIAAVSLALASTAPALADTKPSPRQVKAEAALAKELADRVAGPPVKCIPLHAIRSSRIIDGTAIVYEGAGGVIYVNRPRSGARTLDRNDVLVTKTHTGDLCSIDIVTLFDATSRMQTGFVGLGDFVPYKKVKTASR
jgi:hypothetical protein